MKNLLRSQATVDVSGARHNTWQAIDYQSLRGPQERDSNYGTNVLRAMRDCFPHLARVEAHRVLQP